MTLLHWRPNMSLGADDLDADHKFLIDLLNRIHYMFRAGDEHAAIEAALGELTDYTDRHFHREEAWMRSCGYPDVDRHGQLHKDLRKSLQGWTATYEQDPDGFDAAAFYDFVSDWLLVHVLDEDMKLRPYLPAAASAETH